MSVPDDETLIEIGRFTINFYNLDEVITAMAGAIIECAEWDIAQDVTPRLLGEKLSRIESVCRKLAETYGLENDALLKRIKLAKDVVNARNTVIHGELRIDRLKKPVFQRANKGKQPHRLDASPAALAKLAKEVDDVTDDLITAYETFMDSVETARGNGVNQ